MRGPGAKSKILTFTKDPDLDPGPTGPPSHRL